MYYTQKEDHSQAMRWFERASSMGDVQALFQLSIMHYDGIGTLPNLVSVFVMFVVFL